jgi:RimJ/RimL family protein N-acetyltransferase
VQTAVLARVRRSDADQVAQAAQASLEHLRPFLPWAKPEAVTIEAEREWTRHAEAQWDAGAEYIYLLRQADGGPVLGSFGLHRRLEANAIEIGYWLHVDYTGRGYATAAAGALTQAGLALAGIEWVEIHTDVANTASAAIPQRLGYQLDRVIDHAIDSPSETGRRQVWVKRAQ